MVERISYSWDEFLCYKHGWGKLICYFYSCALLCRRQSICRIAGAEQLWVLERQSSLGWSSQLLSRPSIQVRWRMCRLLRAYESVQHGQTCDGNKPKTAGPPWLLIIQCCSFLGLTGYETPSSPAVETHWGSIGPVGNHHSVYRCHLADCWLPEQLLKAAVHETIHSLN